MQNPALVILGIFAIGALFVVLPVVLTTISEHREPHRVTCPGTGGGATISIDAGRAARAAMFGRSGLTVVHCSLWPEREGCGCECAAALDQGRPEPDTKPAAVRES